MDARHALSVRRPGHPPPGHQKGETGFFTAAEITGPPILARQPGLVSKRQGGKGDDPPEKKGGDQGIGNSIQEGEAPVGAEIIEGKEKREDDQKGQMAQDENRMDDKRIADQADGK